MELTRKKKVEIIADAAVQEKLKTIIREAGAKGFTLVPHVSGEGSRGVRDHQDIFGVLENVMVIVVAPPDVAMRIVEAAMAQLERHARIVLVSDVDVVRGDHF